MKKLFTLLLVLIALLLSISFPSCQKNEFTGEEDVSLKVAVIPELTLTYPQEVNAGEDFNIVFSSTCGKVMIERGYLNGDAIMDGDIIIGYEKVYAGLTCDTQGLFWECIGKDEFLPCTGGNITENWSKIGTYVYRAKLNHKAVKNSGCPDCSAFNGNKFECFIISVLPSVITESISTMPLVGVVPIVSYKTINNKIYLFGLSLPPYMTQFISTTASNQIRTYDLVTNTWSILPFTLPYGIYNGATASYFNGHFYLGPGWATGDVNGWGSHNKMIDVNLSNNTAQETSNQFSSGRIWLVCSIEVNGKIYFFGGWNGSGVNSIFEFIPATNTFHQVASMINGRAAVAPILGNDGWIYIIGSLSTIERFNPATYQVQKMNATVPGTMYYINCWNITEDNSIYFFNSDATVNPIIYKFNYSTDVLTNTGFSLNGIYESRCIMDSNDPYSLYGFKRYPDNMTPLQIVKITLKFN